MVKMFCAFFKLVKKNTQKLNVECHKSYFGFILETLVSLDSIEINIMVHKLNLFSKITCYCFTETSTFQTDTTVLN